MLIIKIKMHITLTETETKTAINTVISDDMFQSEFFDDVSSLCSND